MNASKPCVTPCCVGSLDVESPRCNNDDAKTYHSMVGALHYLTFTWPDISFVVSRVLHLPTYAQFAAVKRIFCYIRSTLSAGLMFEKSSLSLQAFSDSDWAGNQCDRRSTTGFVIYLGDNPDLWVSKKQSTTSRS